ncbi:MAG TPA: hypothetical protein DCY95_12415 [Algoriphagus sp.]|uniref:hypothetical protein n=1 Tax=Algoriphagus sp. TaxID=1872435 RepID=UPI000C3D2C7B|nr:hypothetical protein [Algoriphagus sp.]MAL13339.1 hypothetical protein [Algoriphagus sp.]MAN85595.1 hypothetical protein [Algoriphagus sp.]HAD52684.1 hypothetical protein [Algoriphagus sp.]HAH35128.1 hypothetical protein [Algoriphagus sp.]HAS57961.1 hypothetical protein [Algoriphagus sp.]|tara:strand:+ start:11040 stop:11255 length:216 start_codon:yes stop_codon:yes gene_type:complete
MNHKIKSVESYKVTKTCSFKGVLYHEGDQLYIEDEDGTHPANKRNVYLGKLLIDQLRNDEFTEFSSIIELI